MVLEGFIQIHCMHTWHIKSGKPHIADNNQTKRIIRFFKSLLELLHIVLGLNLSWEVLHFGNHYHTLWSARNLFDRLVHSDGDRTTHCNYHCLALDGAIIEMSNDIF